MCSVMHFNPLAPVMPIFTIILAQSLSQFSGKFWGEVGEFGENLPLQWIDPDVGSDTGVIVIVRAGLTKHLLQASKCCCCWESFKLWQLHQ